MQFPARLSETFRHIPGETDWTTLLGTFPSQASDEIINSGLHEYLDHFADKE